jgi:uncharacterized protein (TIGR03437 family)
MRSAAFVGLGLLAGVLAQPVQLPAESAPPRPAPKYTPSSLVNAASFQTGSIAPNTIVTLYGEGLSWVTRALQSSDIRNNRMPDVLPNTGVRVLIANMPAHIYYVSPRQINLLVPPTLVPGETFVQVVLDGLAGPAIPVRLTEAAPAFFQLDERTVIATAADGAPLTRLKPGRPGDIVILYATGLGPLIPPPGYGEVVRTPATVADARRLRLEINGETLPREHVFYLGSAPGFPGLYQINLRLPNSLPDWPEVRVYFDNIASPAGLALPVTP